MKKNNKGFTLIELLAVIVILAIILVIASTNVIKSINNSKAKSKYIAAKEIVDIASAYIETNPDNKVKNGCVIVKDMTEGKNAYLEEDVTNPDPEYDNKEPINNNQKVCKVSNTEAQTGYEPQGRKYYFDGYIYYLN